MKKLKKPLLCVIVILVLACVPLIRFIAGGGYWDKSKSVDLEAVNAAIRDEFLVVMNGAENDNPIMKAVVSNLELDVSKVLSKKDELVAECRISNHDVQTVLTELEQVKTQMTVEEIFQLITEKIGSAELREEPRKIRIEIHKDQTIAVYLTEEDVDAAMGGFLSYCAASFSKEGES